jgi:hypothetical protein
MIVPRERRSFVQELLVAEVLARRGEGPLARKRWPRLRPPRRADASSAASEDVPSEPEPEPEPER